MYTLWGAFLVRKDWVRKTKDGLQVKIAWRGEWIPVADEDLQKYVPKLDLF